MENTQTKRRHVRRNARGDSFERETEVHRFKRTRESVSRYDKQTSPVDVKIIKRHTPGFPLKQETYILLSPEKHKEILRKNRQLKEIYKKLEEKYRKLEKHTIELINERNRRLELDRNLNKEPENKTPSHANPLFEAAWEFYKSNRKELVENYCDKYIVISGRSVLAAYDDEDTAYLETEKNTPLGSFLIHHITEEEEVIQLSPFICT